MFNIFRGKRGSNPPSPQPPRSPAPNSPGLPSSSSPRLPPPPPVLQDSSISSSPPILPPIPRVASKNDGDRRPQDTAQQVHRKAIAPRPPSQQTSPPSAWRPSYSLGIDFSDAPLLPPIQRVTSNREPNPGDKPPATPPLSADRTFEPTFTLEPPRTPDDSPASTPINKMTRAYTSFADFGRLDLRRGSKFSTDASHSSKSPSTKSRSHSYDPPFLQPASQQASSPSSSISSFPKSASQTNLAAEHSPNSSKSAQGPSPATNSSARLSKARNLLNPVSLLMKRRTSQGVDESDIPVAPQRMFEVPALGVPQGYDPRIKGKRIHDFDDESGKPRRNYSTNDMMGMARQADDVKAHNRRSSIPVISGGVGLGVHGQNTDREHAPVFVENFEEDENPEQAEDAARAIQRESLANPDFLARMSRQIDFDALDFAAPGPASAQARRMSAEPPQTPPQKSSLDTPPLTANRMGAEPQTAFRTSQEPAPRALPDTPTQVHANTARTSKNTDVTSLRVSSDQSTARSSMSNDTGATTPPQHSPPRDSSRHSATLDAPFQPTTPLKHLSSNASRVSRFSFQLNSDRCVEQERALEEKHKAKYAAKATKHTSLADSRFEELEDEDFDYDAMDEGGYEEEIPELGADDEDDGRPVGLGNARWSTLNPPPAVGVTRESSQSQYSASTATEPAQSEPSSAVEMPAPLEPHQPPARTMTRSTVVSDDMYYDDGIIGLQTVSGSSESQHVAEKRLERAFAGIQAVGSPTEADTGSPGNTHSPTPPAVDKSFHEAMRESELRHSTSLHAYHDALASAASKAAKDGRFSRGASVNTASSRYSEEADEGLSLHEDETVFGTQQNFDDTEEDEDPMIAAANAEILASEDAEFYGNEFGFYGTSAVSSDGQMHNGGYFGQPNLLRAALNPRNNEPNLTPITERSEYSTRNSFIGSSPWGPPGSAPSNNAMGLKDIAASLGMDDDDLTLGQLLRLRKAAFEGSVHGSSGSNESSPTSQQASSSPLVFKHASTNPRSSELELPNVSEGPESENDEDALVGDSPISPNVTFGKAKAISLGQKGHSDRRDSAETYAQGYQDVVNGSPPQTELPVFARHERRRSSSPLASLPTVPGRSSPPILGSPAPHRASWSSATASPLSNQMPSSPPLPTPSADMMQKFASRPAPDAYRKSWEPSQRSSMSGPSKVPDSAGGSTSVAYVRDVGADGQEKWYLERRRKRSSGDLVVLSREAVQGGRI